MTGLKETTKTFKRADVYPRLEPGTARMQELKTVQLKAIYIMQLTISSTRTACGLLDTVQVQTLVTATVCHCAVSSPSPDATLQPLLIQGTRLLRTCTVPGQQYSNIMFQYRPNTNMSVC